MGDKKPDRRILYTKMFLRESLLKLMREKPIGKITPTELCRRANINRNTFYTHYDTPEALLHSIEDDLLERIRASLEQPWDRANVRTFLTQICQAIKDNGDLCTVIFSDYGNKEFLRSVFYLAHDKCITEWNTLGLNVRNNEFEKIYTFTVNGSVAVIQQWIQDGMKEPPEEIATLIEKVSYAVPNSFL